MPTTSHTTAQHVPTVQQVQAPGPSAQAVPAAPDRALIREELREMREREKRRESIIIKGLTASGPQDAASKFGRLVETQFEVKVELAEIVQIPGHPTMFRAKILSEEQRKSILDNAKKLRGSPYSTVYISRDLTRAQRTDLYEKRKAKQSAQRSDADSVGGPRETRPEGSTQHTSAAPPAPPPQGN